MPHLLLSVCRMWIAAQLAETAEYRAGNGGAGRFFAKKTGAKMQVLKDRYLKIQIERRSPRLKLNQHGTCVLPLLSLLSNVQGLAAVPRKRIAAQQAAQRFCKII
ncbi:hypothetical protein [Thermoleptolyngbya sp.]